MSPHFLLSLSSGTVEGQDMFTLMKATLNLNGWILQLFN